MQPQTLQNIGYMILDRAFPYHQLEDNFAIGGTVGEQMQNLNSDLQRLPMIYV